MTKLQSFLALAPLFACTAESPTIGQAGQAVTSTPKVSHRRHGQTIAQRPATSDAVGLDKAQCLEFFGFPCFSPLEIQKAYGVSGLIDNGHDGTGETIVIIVSYGSPTIVDDLAVFDEVFGLPDPPSLQVIAPLGTVPFDPTDEGQVDWVYETTLDVEYAHAMAPGAHIVVMTSPVNETEGVQGMPEFLALETYALDHHLGKIISQSWVATENTFFDPAGRAVINQFERFYERARREHVTALAASGDLGAAGWIVFPETVYPFPAVGYPASSPNVTAVGGSELSTDDDGNWSSEVAWQFSGGGVSQIFGEPLWQRLLPRATQRILNGRRGMPDIASNSSGNTPVVCVITDPVFNELRFDLEAGTSVATPTWAGIVADLNHLTGRPLGYLNAKLYLLGELGLLRGELHDITVGNNDLVGIPGFPDVVGYQTSPGWDLVTGWGTPSLARLAQLLASLPDE